jgi:Lipocalin-like domain
MTGCRLPKLGVVGRILGLHTDLGDGIMDRNLKSVVFALIVLFSPAVVHAADNPLLGTWKLKTFVREISGTSERYNQLGEHPNGYISYLNDGRMTVIITADNQIKPRNGIPTDEERIKLHKSMIAYAGTYTL